MRTASLASPFSTLLLNDSWVLFTAADKAASTRETRSSSLPVSLFAPSHMRRPTEGRSFEIPLARSCRAPNGCSPWCRLWRPLTSPPEKLREQDNEKLALLQLLSDNSCNTLGRFASRTKRIQETGARRQPQTKPAMCLGRIKHNPIYCRAETWYAQKQLVEAATLRGSERGRILEEHP